MNKPIINEKGHLVYPMTFKEHDALLSTTSFLIKGVDDLFGSTNDDSSKSLYYSFVKAIRDTYPNITLSDADAELFYHHDIEWMDTKDKEAIEEGMQTFFDVFTTQLWTENGIMFALALKKGGDGSFSVIMQTVGVQVSHEYELDKYEVANDELGTPEDIRQIIRDITRHEEENTPAETAPNLPANTSKDSTALSVSNTGINLQDIPELLSLGTESDLLDREFEVDQASVSLIVDAYLEASVALGEFPVPLTLRQWKEVKDILFGAAYLMYYAKTPDETATLDDLTEILMNEEGRSQVFASVYLMTQTLRRASTDTNIPFVDEVTALIRYLDWYGRPNIKNQALYVFQTVAQMTENLVEED